jgi:hypothetical protein
VELVGKKMITHVSQGQSMYDYLVQAKERKKEN